MKKVLIIKLGYSETLDSALGLTTSLGDVLRTTVILHFFEGDEVNWLVDKNARPLLENNKYIQRLFTYNAADLRRIRKEKFDLIINLEKLPEVCIFSDSLEGKEYFGFRSDSIQGKKFKYVNGNRRLIELSQNLSQRRKNKDCWQKILAKALGKEWQEEPYILGYKPKSQIKYDIGFNWATSNKWSNKTWPGRNWNKLERRLKGKYSVSWQKGLDSIRKYIDWIHSCRLVVTSDSLGLHLCLALKKRVIALFGPTSPGEIYFYNSGVFLLPKIDYKCIPCLRPYCDKERQCMEYILPEAVADKIEEEIRNG